MTPSAARRIPPWRYEARDGQDVVVLSNIAYSVDISKPPAFFFATYLRQRLDQAAPMRALATTVERSTSLERWFDAYSRFLGAFGTRHAEEDYRGLLDADSVSLMMLAYDLYCLDGRRKLQSTLVLRLIDPRSFQGACHEVSVAATMVRAGFDIGFEDEEDSSRKHPEFIATHPVSRQRIAVEAKSIHRRGILGFEGGSPPPSQVHKIAAQIGGQVRHAIRKTSTLPLYVFVDLNLPSSTATEIGPLLNAEFETILPLIDHGFDRNGIQSKRLMNLLVIMNRPMHLGEWNPQGGDILNLFAITASHLCRFPGGSAHVREVEDAVTRYGTFAT